MDDVGTPDTTDAPIDFLPDDTTNGTGQEVDSVSSLTDASFFGYSIRGDFAKVAAAEANANLLQNQPGSERFTLPNNGPVKNLPGGEEKTEEEKALDDLREAAAYIDEERERQREEWERTESIFAGITKTGVEWSEFSNDLKQDSPLRRWLIEKMKHDGKTTAQAEAMTDTLAELTHIQSIPKEQRTAEQQQMLDLADQNPEYKKYTKAAAEKEHEFEGTNVEAHKTAVTATQEQSSDTRADVFATAPQLTAHHREAVAAITPIDQSSPPATPPPPAPPPSNSAGLDL